MSKPIRILHVIGAMVRGGSETWLMQLLRNIDRSRFKMDFLVHTDESAAFDEEIRSFGSKVLPCLVPSRPIRYASRFLEILRRHGPYDVVHSHAHYFSGYTLWLAAVAGVRGRIAHSHNDTAREQAAASPLRSSYLSLMGWAMNRYATHGLACSRPAAAALFGPAWAEDGRWQIQYCAMDFAPFAVPTDRAAVRRSLGLSPSAFVVGHVGRFDEQKNHGFLLDLAAEVMARDPAAHLLLVGDGPLRPEMEAKAARLGLSDRVTFAGVRADVPRLLKSMDAFVLPSFYEGLPLVALEAQAAGLPIVAADAFTSEFVVLGECTRRLPLSDPLDSWARGVLACKSATRVDRSEALARMAASPFDISRSILTMQDIYVQAASGPSA